MRIYFLHTGIVSFIRKDLEILRSRHEVKDESNFRRALRNIWRNLKGVVGADCVFCWFGSLHFLFPAILAKILRKKLVIVSGGYDVANVPEIRYGSMRGGMKTSIARFMFRLADRVLCVSESGRRDVIRNVGVPHWKSKVIYPGFLPPSHKSTIDEKENLVVTVGGVSESNLKRKGLITFVRSAAYLPEVPFVLIGEWKDGAIDLLKAIASPNVEFTGRVSDKKLNEYLRRAKVYVQVSAHEGFGCSLAEAMLWGCIPVVTDRYSLPEVVGDTGIFVPYGDPEKTAEGIRTALGMGDSAGEAAQERIVSMFSLEKRQEELLRAIDELFDK
ncbi:MAG: glycosyltransferase family 4 protein [bacterium]